MIYLILGVILIISVLMLFCWLACDRKEDFWEAVGTMVIVIFMLGTVIAALCLISKGITTL